MMTKQKGNGWVLVAGLISMVLAFFSFAGFMLLAFNISGFADLYKEMLFGYSANLDLDEQVTMACLELALVFMFDVYYACFYLKGYKYKINSQQYGQALITKGVFQMLIASLPAGIFAIIGGVSMTRTKKTVKEATINQNQNQIPPYKFEAMSEAVARLKELKEKGAISEEEYYATLDKILES